MNTREYARARHGGARAAYRGRTSYNVLELTIIVVVAALLVVALFSAVAADRMPPETAMIPVIVTSSDSLWSLAREYPLKGRPTAQTVAAIRDINGMTGSMLRVGDVLLVPALVPVGTVVASR